MTGAEILAKWIDGEALIEPRRRAGIDEASIAKGREIEAAKPQYQADPAVVAQWIADKDTVTAEQRRTVARKMRVQLMAGGRGQYPANMGTLAALIDILEA